VKRPKCETCTHWRHLDYPSDPAAGGDRWGDCEFAPGPQDDTAERSGEVVPPRSKRMSVHDASFYVATLMTRSDFGCVEHAEAPPP